MDIHDFPIAFTAILPTGPECLESADLPSNTPGDEKICFIPHHEIWDIGLIVASPDKLEVMDSFSAAIKIDRPEIIHDLMMQTRGPFDTDKLNSQAEHPVNALNNYFSRVKRDYVFSAFRVELELQFLQIYSEVYGIRPLWWPHKIDVYSYALGTFDILGRKLPSPDIFRIATSLKILVPSAPYRAINHACLTYEIFKKLRSMKLKSPI